MATSAHLSQELHEHARNNTLAQVYAIYGPSPAVSFRLATEIAHALESEGVKKHEEPLIDGRIVDGSLRKMGIDEARSYAEFLYKKPVKSSRRTLVIHRADLFSDDAQHALLKLAEEPPPHALIFFTLRTMDVLMQTLGSRVQKLYCGDLASPADLTEIEKDAHKRVVAFLALRPTERGAFIKSLIEEDAEIRDAMPKERRAGIAHDAFIVEPFVAALIQELARDPHKNLRPLAEALKRQSLMSDHTVSKKIQLEAISALLP